MTCTLMGPGVKQRGKSINICQESGFPVTKIIGYTFPGI